jgi:hypothetical protein
MLLISYFIVPKCFKNYKRGKKQFNVQSVQRKVKECTKKLIDSLVTMSAIRIPKQILQYQPKGRRDLGRSGKDGTNTGFEHILYLSLKKIK